MPLINDPASLPSPMWAVVRLLATASRILPVDQARGLLCPPSLLSEGEREKDHTFDQAVRTLQELDLLAVEGEQIGLTGPAAALSADDLDSFTDLVRRSVLDPQRNLDLGADAVQTGPRDLVRALAWFLTQDPLGQPLGWDEVSQRQDKAFADHIGKPIVNDTRWSRFCFWAPALGLAAAPTLGADGRGGQKLIADCTAAVKRIILGRWREGDRLDAVEAVDRILDDLPVLPGGRYSRELGLPAPLNQVAPSLSFALLRGHDDGWLRLDRSSDAPRQILLVDPDAASGFRRVSEIIVVGDING